MTLIYTQEIVNIKRLSVSGSSDKSTIDTKKTSEDTLSSVCNNEIVLLFVFFSRDEVFSV